MPRSKIQKRKAAKRTLVSCGGLVNAWDGYLYVRADRREGVCNRDGLMVLNIKGDFTAAIRSVAAFILRIYPEQDPQAGTGAIPFIGLWTSTKPMFDGAVYLSYREFDLLLAMAQAGKLVSVHLSFQEPYYGKSLIASVSFSGEPPEDR